ncbi:TPA: hypothetical protein I8Y21_003629 [Klebsiella oxytoca]|uniref:Uncharacterized protein n=1 Tax=Klebsiella oxytoca TaxID=571 RepID=A0AAN5LAM2_KLEOX|nr:hypothetical protein [Klebsiella oxytoca]
MSDKKISLPAGSACTSCNYPDPCLFRITVDKFDGQKHTWPVEKKIKLNVLDSGVGSQGTIKVEGKCSEPDCPRATLVSGNEQILLKPEVNNAFTLYYNKRSDQDQSSQPWGASIWSFLNQIILPSDAVDSPHSYKLITEGCIDKSSHVQIDVYPELEVRAVIGFSYSLEGKERSWKERRDERIAARKKMENVLPKNGNKLRSGWTLHTDQFQITRSISLNIDYGLKVCGTDMSFNFAEATRKIKTVRTFEQIGKVEKFISNINNHLLPDPDSSKDRKYKVLSMTVEPIRMGVSYAFQRTSTYDDTTHFMGLYASPFLCLKMKVDLISLIAAYCKIKTIADKCRKYIDEGGNTLECYLQLSIAIDLSIGSAYKNQSWTFDAGSDNKLSFTLEGVVSVAFETKVLFVEISLDASGKIKTEAGFKLDPHDDGIDLVGYHDGIVAEVALSADFKMDNGLDNTKSLDNKPTYKSKFVIGAPLKASESPVRVNLLGKEKMLSR